MSSSSLPNDRHEGAAATAAPRQLCPWCKTPRDPDDSHCCYCGRSRAEAEDEARRVNPRQRYRTIVADPPWPISWNPGSDKIKGGAWWSGDRVQKPGRAMAYRTMPLDEIIALDVGSLAEDDAALFLWSTRKVFRNGDAARVARAWGFEPCGEIIWGLRSPGLGTGPFRNDHEPVLVARRGSVSFPGTIPLGVHFWKQPYEWTGRAPAKIHSAKPEGFLDLVETISEGPYVELFARRNRLGWDTWGDQALNHVEVA